MILEINLDTFDKLFGQNTPCHLSDINDRKRKFQYFWELLGITYDIRFRYIDTHRQLLFYIFYGLKEGRLRSWELCDLK